MRIKIVHNAPLETTLGFEEVYPENLQLDLETKQELQEDGTEFIYLVDEESGILLGETYYIPLDNMEDWEPDEHQKEDGCEPFYGKKAAYVYSTTILPTYEGRGLGRLLKSYMLGYIKASGFELVIGHARESTGSIHLNEYFGAEKITPFENWYQTGETFWLYKQAL